MDCKVEPKISQMFAVLVMEPQIKEHQLKPLSKPPFENKI